MMRVLVAGVGNIFWGDDAFGVEVVRELARRSLPSGVSVMDFGIRGYDLAYALVEGYDAAILVDAIPRGESPGTVSLLELDLANLGSGEPATLDAHSLDPVRVLQMAQGLGRIPERLYLVGCEPGQLESPDGRLGLSVSVQAGVPLALEMIESLIAQLLKTETTIGTGALPA